MYDNDELLDILLEHVSGDAKKAVSGILPASGQFDRAMKILQELCRNTRMIVNSNLATLRSHVVVQDKKADQLRSLCDVISTMIELFRSLDLEHELKSSIIVHNAVSKMAQTLIYRWHEWATGHPIRSV